MKITCLKENIKNIISITERIVGKNLSLPVLSYFLLGVEKNMLKISATDLEIGVDAWVNCKIEREGRILVPAKLFSSIISNISDQKINIEVKEKLITISTQNYNATLVGLDYKEFPIIPRTENNFSIELDAKLLREAFVQVINAAATNNNRIEINSVFIKKEKNIIKIVATDTFRLAEKTIYLQPNITNENFSFLVPLRTIHELVKILETKEKITLFFDKNKIIFETENICLFSRLIEGNFPDYEQVIPKEFETVVDIEKQELINHIKLIGLLSGKDNKITVKAKNKKLDLYSASGDQGENNASLSCEIEGKENEVSFNYHYLIDGLLNINQGSNILLKLNSTSAGMIKAKNKDDYFYLVMPIKNF